MALQKPSQVPLHTSARPPKPSAKKRSLSYSQQHAPYCSKKPKAYSSTVSTLPELLPTQSNTELIEISDKDQDQDQDQEDEDEDEDQDQEEDIEDDDAEEGEGEEEEEASSFKFKTTWKALCGKENLPGIRSAYFNKGALFIIDIELWKKKVLQDL